MHLYAISFPLLISSYLMCVPSYGTFLLKHMGAQHTWIWLGPVICSGTMCPGPRRMRKGGPAWALWWAGCVCGEFHFPHRKPHSFCRRWWQELLILPQQSLPSPLTDFIQLHSWFLAAQMWWNSQVLVYGDTASTKKRYPKICRNALVLNSNDRKGFQQKLWVAEVPRHLGKGFCSFPDAQADWMLIWTSLKLTHRFCWDSLVE